MSVLALFLHGYEWQAGDNESWIPFVHEAMSPGSFAGDSFLLSPQGRLTFYVDGMAILTRALGQAQATWLVYLVVHATTFIAFAFGARAILGDDAGALLATLALCMPCPVGGTATVSLETIMLPRTAAVAAGLLGLALALAGHAAAAGLALGLCFLGNPLVALGFGVALAARAVACRDARSGLPRLVAVAVVVGTPLLLRAMSSREAVGVLEAHEWTALLRRNIPYAFFSEWSRSEWLMLALPAILVVLGAGFVPRRQPLVALAVGATAWSFAGGLAAEALELPSLLVVQPPRALLVMVLLGLACAGGVTAQLLRAGRAHAATGAAMIVAVASQWRGWQLMLIPLAALLLARNASATRRRVAIAVAAACVAGAATIWSDTIIPSLGSPRRWAILASVAAIAGLAAPWLRRPGGLASAAAAPVLALGLLVLFGARPLELPGQPGKWSSGLSDWARNSVPRATRFGVWPPIDGFRATAERPVLLEPGDRAPAVLTSRSLRDWSERDARYGAAAPVENLVEALRTRTIDVLAIRRDVTDAAPATSGLLLVYEDATWQAFVLPGIGHPHG